MALNEHISDYDLVEKLNKNDLDAFDLIFKRYSDRLFGFALKYLKSKEETEELVQDVFLKLWENRSKLKKESSLKSYLFTISYHNMCKLFRRKKYHEKLKLEIGSTAGKAFDLNEQIDYKSALEQVDRLIEQLPQKQKIIFSKSRKEGKSTREIADEMKLAPGTIDNQISAALKFLRAHISTENFALLLLVSVFM